LLSLLILIAIIISLLYLVWGGFDWITSTGEKQKIEKARTKIVFALLGLVVVFISFFIVNVLAGFFKVG
jgi:TRAP-type C4-dicarboxylate transport system permease small subunit